MVADIDYMLPGKPLLPAKPWLRQVDDTVIRFVRKRVEGKRVALARSLQEFSGGTILEETLEKEASDLSAHLFLLRELGVPVVQTTVEVTGVPVDYSKNDDTARGVMRGLMLRSELINGPNLYDYLSESEDSEQKQQITEPLATGLSSYLQESAAEHSKFLGDIFGSWQFVVARTLAENEPMAKLVDVDPLFSEATPRDIALAEAGVSKLSDVVLT